MSTPGFSDQPVPILVPRSWPRAGALDSINQYSAVVIIDGLVAILFMIGYVLFGVAMIRTGTLPRWSGLLVAAGAPAHLLGFRDSPARLDGQGCRGTGDPRKLLPAA